MLKKNKTGTNYEKNSSTNIQVEKKSLIYKLVFKYIL